VNWVGGLRVVTTACCIAHAVPICVRVAAEGIARGGLSVALAGSRSAALGIERLAALAESRFMDLEIAVLLCYIKRPSGNASAAIF
jgi:hypothetical protein